MNTAPTIIKEKKVAKNENPGFEKKLDSFIKTFLTHENLEESEISKFREVASALSLDPFNKEIYPVSYDTTNFEHGKPVKKKQISLITGYEVYLRKADLFPTYQGYRTEFAGSMADQKNFECIVTVYREDRKYPIVHRCRFSEFAGKKKDGGLTKFWLKMPYFMLEKVAIAQGMRRAFPNDFSQMPFIREELENEITDITPEKNNNDNENPVKITLQSNEKTDNIIEEADDAIQQLKKAKEKLTGNKNNIFEKPLKNFDVNDAKDEILKRARKITNILSKEQIRHYQSLKNHENYDENLHDEELMTIANLEKDFFDNGGTK